MLGTLSLASYRPVKFQPELMRLLHAMGDAIGIGMANAIAAQDLREASKLREQLLEKLISAQEEERKRISRELHDEYGQTLAGLIMNIESMEKMLLAEQPELKKKLKDAAEKEMGQVRKGFDEQITRLERVWEDFRNLKVGDLKPEDDVFQELQDRYSLYFEAHMGAESIQRRLAAFDLAAEAMQRDGLPAHADEPKREGMAELVHEDGDDQRHDVADEQPERMPGNDARPADRRDEQEDRRPNGQGESRQAKFRARGSHGDPPNSFAYRSYPGVPGAVNVSG